MRILAYFEDERCVSVEKNQLTKTRARTSKEKFPLNSVSKLDSSQINGRPKRSTNKPSRFREEECEVVKVKRIKTGENDAPREIKELTPEELQRKKELEIVAQEQKRLLKEQREIEKQQRKEELELERQERQKLLREQKEFERQQRIEEEEEERRLQKEKREEEIMRKFQQEFKQKAHDTLLTIPQKVQQPKVKEIITSGPQTPVSFPSNFKGLSKLEMARLDKMTKEEREKELSEENYKLYTMQTVYKQQDSEMINSNNLLPTFLLPEEAEGKPKAYEMTTIISYMMHADGTDDSVAKSREICEIIERHFILFMNKIIERIVNQNSAKRVSRDVLASFLIPHRKLIRIIEYEFALIDHIKSQRANLNGWKEEKVECSSIDEESLVDDAKFVDNVSEDENPFAGIPEGFGTKQNAFYNNPKRWQSECLQGDANDGYFEEFDQIKHERRLFRDIFSRNMTAEELQYFHYCSTKRIGDPKKFKSWLDKNTLLENVDFELDNLAIDALSFLLDFRVHALVKETLKGLNGTPYYSADVYQKILSEIITAHENNDITDFRVHTKKEKAL